MRATTPRPLVLPDLNGVSARRRVDLLSGSTIGNLTPPEATDFLQNARAVAGPGGGLLIGVDLKKDPARLHAAYNDAQGVTARFNLNLLARINRELDADFDLRALPSRGVYNAPLGRIEMHLVSEREQQVSVRGRAVRFRPGETIHTENSYKYSIEEFQALCPRRRVRAGDVLDRRAAPLRSHYLTVPQPGPRAPAEAPPQRAARPPVCGLIRRMSARLSRDSCRSLSRNTGARALLHQSRYGPIDGPSPA